MKIISIEYDASKKGNATQVKEIFKLKAKDQNVVYLFCDEEACLYIGESENSLYERCYVNTPKHSMKPWFIESNKVFVMKLDEKVNKFSRRAVEAVLIAAICPKYNKK